MLKVLCPVKKIKLQIGSELLDVVSSFTRFVLWAVDRGFSAKYLANTVILDENLIQSEIDYLVQIGYLSHCGKNYVVTVTGQEFLRLINLVENFNSGEHYGKINLFTGKFSGECQNIRTIQISSAQDKDNYLHSGFTIQKVVNPFLLLNHNYDISREYVLQTYQDEFRYLSPEQLESLYVRCVGVKTGEEKFFSYLQYVLPKIPKWNDRADVDCVNKLILKRTVDVFCCRYRTKFSDGIDKWYQEKSQITESELLSKLKKEYKYSDKICREIISDYFYLQELGENYKVYVDEGNGQYLANLPEDDTVAIQDMYQAEKLIIDVPSAPIEVPDRAITVRCKSGRTIQCTLFLTLEERKICYQFVDFSGFEEM